MVFTSVSRCLLKKECISLFVSTDLYLAQGQTKCHFTLSIIDAFYPLELEQLNP